MHDIVQDTNQETSAMQGSALGIATRAAESLPGLSVLRQFVGWRDEDRGGSKPTKPPISPRTGQYASISDPSTWGTLEDASRVRGAYGIAFALTEDDPYSAVDLDGCLDDLGMTKCQAVDDLIELFDTYTEITPSGFGLRFFGIGEHAAQLKNVVEGEWGDRFEIYTAKHFVSVTGNSYHQTPKPIRDIQVALDAVAPRFVKPKMGDTDDPQPTSGLDAVSYDDLPESVKQILAEDWDDRSDAIWHIGIEMKRCGYSIAAAYATARLNKRYAEKMDMRSRGSQGMDYFRPQVWDRITYTGGDGESDGRNADALILADCFAKYSPELTTFEQQALAVISTSITKHGNLSSAHATRDHTLRPKMHCSQGAYHLFYHNRTHPNYRVAEEGRKGQGTTYDLDTPANRRKIETWKSHEGKGHHNEPPRPKTYRDAIRPKEDTKPQRSAVDDFRELCRQHRKEKRKCWKPDENGFIDPDYDLIRSLSKSIDHYLPNGAIRSSSWKGEDYEMVCRAGYVRKARTKKQYLEIVLPSATYKLRPYTPVQRPSALCDGHSSWALYRSYDMPAQMAEDAAKPRRGPPYPSRPPFDGRARLEQLKATLANPKGRKRPACEAIGRPTSLPLTSGCGRLEQLRNAIVNGTFHVGDPNSVYDN